MKIVFLFENGIGSLPFVKSTTNYVALSLPKDAKHFPEDLESWGSRYSVLSEVLYVKKDNVLGALYQNESGELVREMNVADEECL